MDIKDVISSIEPVDEVFFDKAKQRTSNLIMPFRAVGMLNDISERLCAIQRSLKPETDKRCVFVMASDHGVVEEGVSAFPRVVTCEMIRAFVDGIATINVLARQNNARVVVCDVGTKCDFESRQLSGENEFVSKKVSLGSKNFTKTAAMRKDEAILSIMSGFEIAKEKIEEYNLNLIATGDMGIGNTTPSAAIASVILNRDPSEIAGRGTGIDDRSYKNKIDVIRRGIQLNKPNRNDVIDVLAKVGGFEIGAIAGVMLAAAFKKIPVVVDGFISTAGALIAYGLNPTVADYMFAGHLSEENGHKLMLEHLGLNPILRLNMRLGEGTGAVLAMHIIDASARVIKEVATFEEAGVSESEK
ncbi:nicotinate-nucleotide--dimethylbenzimidazole phosphoribosyltransferase [Hippea maritima]|uniref:Nicotinate-nucleotide--dimethylbenzimidazole phosphoribosyltransferase n=1 Tax=Hippea maritima (strain ATCC 700847 / DSM 10411 / MH2) TaxID=760142 RepID=F2LWS3_HIPMA|nr:nicotinate-nucleotide--dimethylbenzimidazole phosphoribosyltransferase [Hippea maritima]AEA33051.1 Nicotinate-nucleotide--dimethylbenzimidazole phosphoribosyltransferase [Hippea maritima DSM 10411]